MTHNELLKLHQLKGTLQAQSFILETEIDFTSQLIEKLETEQFKMRAATMVAILKDWLQYNIHLLNEVCQLIEEAKNV